MKINRIKIFLKNMVAFRKSFFKSLAVNAGIALAVHEALEWLVSSPNIGEFMQSYFIFGYPLGELFTSPLIYLCIVILCSLLSQIGSANFCEKMNNSTGCYIEISMNDIFKNKGQLIIPSDNIFSCDLNHIGSSSIKAQMMLRMSSNNDKTVLHDFGTAVEKQLGMSEYDESKIEGKKQILGESEYQVYKYGTIVPVNVKLDKKERSVLLLAMSEIISPGIPKVDNSTLLENIDKMWNYIANHHTKYDTLVVPVMGTGAAHAAIEKQLVARYILYSFAENAPKLGLKKMILSVYPDDYVNDEINIAELKEYAEFLCKFPSSHFTLIKDQ